MLLSIIGCLLTRQLEVSPYNGSRTHRVSFQSRNNVLNINSLPFLANTLNPPEPYLISQAVYRRTKGYWLFGASQALPSYLLPLLMKRYRIYSSIQNLHLSKKVFATMLFFEIRIRRIHNLRLFRTALQYQRS